MTALQQYQRLETSGLWRSAPGAQRREVTVSFGNATLVISDSAGRALTHWSLPAVEQISADETATLYAPDTDATETLEINDPMMVDAIETVRKALMRQRPKQGRLRLVSRLAIFAGLAGLAIFWLPDALRQQTLAIVTQTNRTEIGATILGHLQVQSGAACRSTQGQQALGRLHRRIFGAQATGRIVVLPSNDRRAIPLPGGIIVIDQGVLGAGDDPAVPAGFAIAADATAQAHDPLGAVLDYAGLRETMRLLTTGSLPNDVLAGYATHLSKNPPAPLGTQTLVAAFAQADIPALAYAQATGHDALAKAGSLADAESTNVLTDSGWVSLQGICDT